MNTLIIGGTTGLGLELAKKYHTNGDVVIVTGRKEVKVPFEFKPFDLSEANLASRIGIFISEIPTIERLVYAAGYFQEGRITDLSDDNIEEMINVGGRGLIYFVKSILEKQGSLEELVTITSTSQWTPRQKEPIYNFIKAGGAHFSNAVAEDGRVAKVLVAGPAGMRTAFWEDVERDDLDEVLDPSWVADQIVELENDTYTYRFVRILRQPARVEIIETR
jgi:short-subunit dehydrogenase